MFPMNFNKYQQEAAQTWMQVEIDGPNTETAHDLAYQTIGLIGEAGELANKVKKIFRDGDGVITEEALRGLKGELGDILWYLNSIASCLGLSMSEVARDNIQKLRTRKEQDKIGGEGDDR